MDCASRFSLRVLHSFLVVLKIFQDGGNWYNLIVGFCVFTNIVPVPKFGDLSKTDNYRGISLTCIIVKMYNLMILNCIKKAIAYRLRMRPNGFRPKGTTEA